MDERVHGAIAWLIIVMSVLGAVGSTLYFNHKWPFKRWTWWQYASVVFVVWLFLHFFGQE